MPAYLRLTKKRAHRGGGTSARYHLRGRRRWVATKQRSLRRHRQASRKQTGGKRRMGAVSFSFSSFSRKRNRRIRSSNAGRGGNVQNYKQATCSPLSQAYKEGDPVAPHTTCLPKEKILEIKDLWNRRHPHNRIEAIEPTLVWEKIKHQFPKCDNDLCVLNQPALSAAKKTTIVSKEATGGTEQVDVTEYYAPKMPVEWKKNPTEWLSNIEMTEKMKPYEKAYPCFKFIGPTAIDFDKVLHDKQCVENDLCHFQLATYLEGKHKKSKIGIIFNTDPHNKGGSHWISLFIDIPKKLIFFFDSAGDKAPTEVENFVKRVMEQGQSMVPPIAFTFDQNYPNEHQYSTTECGMYSLYFIINMLEDKLTPEFLKTKQIPDEMMIAFRKKYFNDV